MYFPLFVDISEKKILFKRKKLRIAEDITYLEKKVKKNIKNTRIMLTIKRALCYSKKCAIVESYAMILHEKLSHKALFRRFCDNRAFCGPQKK